MNLTPISIGAKKLLEKGVSNDNIIFVLDTQAHKITIEASIITKYDDKTEDVERRVVVLRGDDYDEAISTIFPTTETLNLHSVFRGNLINHFIAKMNKGDIR